MQNDLTPYRDVVEKALAENLRDFAADVRLNDVGELIALVHKEQFGNLESLISSSSEQYFSTGTLRFARSADVILEWGSSPAIILDMEFHHREVDAYFRLQLTPSSGGVELGTIQLRGKTAAANERVEQFVAAIRDARRFAASAAAQDKYEA